MNEIGKIIESEIKRASVFIDESKLYPEYVPPRLPHREDQIRQLSRLFKYLLIQPGSASIKALLAGPIGSGKTVTSIVFGTELSKIAEARGIKLRYVHINCSKSSNPASIFRELKNQLGLGIPDRGLSATELVNSILRLMDRENLYALVAFDEFDYFLRAAKPDERYLIVRFYDVFEREVKRLSFIYIIRGTPAYISSLVDEMTGSYLMKNMVIFEPYKAKELYDILRDRVELAFYPGVVSDEVIEYISQLIGVDTGGDGNARKALAVLHAAGKLAEKEISEGKSARVTINHVRAVFMQEYPSLVSVLDTLYYLPLHELLIFKAIAVALLRSGEDYVPIGYVEKIYRELCDELGEKPRGHTKVYTYVNDLKNRGLIMTKTSLKGRRGRSTYIGFGMVPLENLIEKLDKLIRERRLVR